MSKLKFLYSVMGAGKTTYLLKQVELKRKEGFQPFIIKPTIDNREGCFLGFGSIKSRILDTGKLAFYTNNINIDKILNLRKTSNFDIIFVDEAQFFNREDILALTDLVDIHNIPVVCVGLKTDCNGNLFEGSKSLLSLADTIEQIGNVQCQCGVGASMHIRYINGIPDTKGDSIAIEKDNVTYATVCRKCWKESLK